MRLARRDIWLGALGLGIFMLTAAALSLHKPGSIWAGTLARKDTIVALMLASAALYGGAVWLVTAPAMTGRSFYVVLALAAAMRIMLLASPPFMSSDIYRYVWDGRVQAAGINPYAYVPADPALAGLRDEAIFGRINRANYARTIYPPAAELIFAAVGRVSQSVFATKLAMLAFEAAGIAAMLRLLAMAGLPRSRILIYAWNPLALWAVAGDGHIDGAAIGLVGLAMWAWATKRDFMAGALIGGAILTKFLPVIVLPALWRRWQWKLPLACAGVIVVLYACYAEIGWHVLGFLPQYTAEEGLRQGNGFWLLAAAAHLWPLPPATNGLYLTAGAAALILIGARIAFQPGLRRDPVGMAGDAALLAAVVLAIMSPHYPWYYAWLALPSCLAARPSFIWLSAAPLILYSDPWHDEILIPTAVFVPAIVLAMRDYIRAKPHFITQAAERIS